MSEKTILIIGSQSDIDYLKETCFKNKTSRAVKHTASKNKVISRVYFTQPQFEELATKHRDDIDWNTSKPKVAKKTALGLENYLLGLRVDENYEIWLQNGNELNANIDCITLHALEQAKTLTHNRFSQSEKLATMDLAVAT